MSFNDKSIAMAQKLPASHYKNVSRHTAKSICSKYYEYSIQRGIDQMERAKCQGNYNAETIKQLRISKDKAWKYIKTVPEEYRKGCISTAKVQLKVVKPGARR